MIARQITADAPISHVRYTAQEQARRDEMDAFRTEWNRLRAKWATDNAKLTRERKRAAVITAHLQTAKVIVKDDGPEIITSAPARTANPLADTVVIPFEIPFPLCRPVLRGKVAPKRRVLAIGNFFRAVNVFING